MRQRGNVLVVLVLVIVAAGALYAVFQFIDAHWETAAGVAKGSAQTQKKWDDANKAAQDEADRDRLAREAEARQHAKDLLAANARADDNDTKWRRDRAANRKPLATFECPPGPAPEGRVQPVLADTGADSGGGVRLRLSDDFLRLYDRAWTGQEGQPIYGDPGGVAAAPGPAVGLDAVLDTHQANAAGCSKDRRQMNKLIDLILKLRSG